MPKNHGRVQGSCFLQVLMLCALCCVIPGKLSAAPKGSKGATPKKVTHPEVPRMPAAELRDLLAKKADIIIVDAQSPDGFEMWHIPSAINITYDVTANPMDRQLLLMALPLDKQIVIYCLCEEGTDSANMALELRQLGYSSEKIKVLEDGLVLWDEKGYPMVRQKVAD